ncbi:TetR family transcriptional regulator [Maritimibacter sp. DP07]|uniref:TetR family transcriptional regulator n=1 Tax=Maritimibacter harenae TaxID=2606218 RepID=A0A845M367_9RHOB|nr:TetR/AcrR family transcriptional regulator [Maritimibacter harenae]MZR12187.1 TetR family transcriptional regulator [Maritimibacter harenae]
MKTARPTINDEVAAFKRARTLEAATDLFYEKGYNNSTLDDVAERLGVTKPFIYKNFGNKHMLLATICAQGIQGALGEMEAALAQNAGPAETLRIFVPRYVEAIIAAQKSIAIHIREEKNLLPEDANRLAALRQKFMGQVQGVLEAGKKAGEVDVPDPRISAFAIVGAVSWLTFWFHPEGPLSPEELTERMTAVILNLLRSGGVRLTA